MFEIFPFLYFSSPPSHCEISVVRRHLPNDTSRITSDMDVRAEGQRIRTSTENGKRMETANKNFVSIQLTQNLNSLCLVESISIFTHFSPTSFALSFASGRLSLLCESQITLKPKSKVIYMLPQSTWSGVMLTLKVVFVRKLQLVKLCEKLMQFFPFILITCLQFIVDDAKVTQPYKQTLASSG